MLAKQLSSCLPKPRPLSPGDLDNTLMLLYRKQIFIRKKGKCDYKVNSNNSCKQTCCHSIPYCIRSSIVMTSPPPSPPNGRRQVMYVGRREMPSISFLNMDGSHPPLIPPSPLLSSPPILPSSYSPAKEWIVEEDIPKLIYFSSFLIVSHRFSSYLIVSHRFSSFLIVSHRFSSFLIISYRFSSFLIFSNRFSPFLIVSHCFSSFLILSHHFSSFLVICHRFSSFLVVSRRFSSYLIVSYRFSSFFIVSHRFSLFLIISYHFWLFLKVFNCSTSFLI